MLLLAAVSVGRNEGAVIADFEDPELSVMEQRCKDILQEAVKARCSNGS